MTTIIHSSNTYKIKVRYICIDIFTNTCKDISVYIKKKKKTDKNNIHSHIEIYLHMYVFRNKFAEKNISKTYISALAPCKTMKFSCSNMKVFPSKIL